MALQRVPGHEHIPRYPSGWVVIRFFQLFFAVAILGLSAYTIYATRTAAATNGLGLFTALVTVIISIWLISAHTCSPRAFNYWAVLFFDLYLYIFWLTTFSLAAAWSVVIFGAGYSLNHKRKSYAFCDNYFDNYDDVGYYNKYCVGNGGFNYGVNYKVFGGVVAGIAGLGAIEFLLFFIAWVTDAVVIYRHRRDGGHARKGRNIAGTVGAPYQVQMQPQTKSDYHAVPQQGIPFNQQETAYNPQGMYNPPAQSYPPQQQPFYPQQHPIAPQHTGNTFVQTQTPPPGGYPAPQYPPQQPAAPYHPNY